MDRLSEMEAFVTVVDQGGFTGAADRMGISKSAVSKNVAALENRLGVRLLNRTTRRVSPTEIGLNYYDRAKKVLGDAGEADEMVMAMQSSPRGHLKITMPVSFGQRFMGPAIAQFLSAHPEVSIDTTLDDRFVDMIADGFDLAIRIGALPDSSLRVRKIAETRPLILGAPSYLEAHGTPRSVDDLNSHKLLRYSVMAAGNYWRVISKSGEERLIRANGPLAANNGDVLKNAAINGVGLAILPSFFICDALEDGSLVEVLADTPQPPFGIHVVYPPGLYIQPKTRAFIDFLSAYFKTAGVKNWERCGCPLPVSAP